MKCRKCGSINIMVTLEQDSARTRKYGIGLLRFLVRLTLIFCTCGLWLFIAPRLGTNKTKFRNRKLAICQNCGKSWYI